MDNINKIIKLIKNEVILFVKIVPNSKKNQILEILEYNTKFYLKIKIKEIALENKANLALIKFLSEILDTSKSFISIESGQTLSYKSIKIKNLSLNYVQEKISQFLKESSYELRK